MAKFLRGASKPRVYAQQLSRTTDFLPCLNRDIEWFPQIVWQGIQIYRELFQAWEMWPSPHSEKPVGSEVGGQDPRPWIGSPVGNQACNVPRLL